MWGTLVGVVALLAAVGCGDDDVAGGDAGTDGGEPAGPVAIFEVSDTGPVPYEMAPFPNAVFRGDDGTLDLGSAPGGSRYWQAVLERVNERPGFCRSCPIAFPIEGELDPESVPEDAMGPGAASDPILLMRADGEGGLLGVQVDATSGYVSIRPAGLRLLEPETRYVAALTDAITGPGGRPLAPTESFRAIREGTDTTSRAAASVLEALDALEAAGVERERVVSVSIFTTADTATLHREIGLVVDAAAVPVATVDRVYQRSDGTLDELYGTPDEDLPGFLAVTGGAEGETAVAHGDVEMVVLGSFDAPRIVAGTGTDIGFLRRGADGALEAGPSEPVPFALSIPVGADPSALPVAVTATGLPGSRILGPGMAQTFAKMGVATISIDPFQSGSRAADAADERSELRSIDGPDGIADVSRNSVLRVQGADGNGEEVAFHPGFGEAAVSQMVSDLAMLIRFLQEGDLSAVADVDASLAGLTFDADALYYVGLSYGGLTGASAMAIRPGIAAAVINATFGAADLAACQGPVQRPLGEQLASLVLGIRGTFDEVERRLCMDPAFAFVNMLIEDFNTSNVVHYLLDAPLHDQPPPHVLFQQAGHDENVGLATGESLLLAMGGPIGGADAFEFTTPSLEAGPFADNRETPNGTVTVAGWMFGGAEHEMLIRRETERSWRAPLRAPFVAWDPPETLPNPTDDVHAQIAAFVQSHLDGGPVSIAAP